MPTANELTVGIMALVAQEERKAITRPGPSCPCRRQGTRGEAGLSEWSRSPPSVRERARGGGSETEC
jgi:hypothetical protein